MKRFFVVIAVLSSAFSSCLKLGAGDPYADDLYRLEIVLEAPDGDAPHYSSARVSVEDINNGALYSTACDATGKAFLDIPNGVYMVVVSVSGEGASYNGARSGVVVGGEPAYCTVALNKLRLSDIVIKEVYSGGCMRYPKEGTYQADQYFILHNNSPGTVFLDGLCFGTLDPYNSHQTSVWDEDIDFVPIIQAIWQFPGDGEDFPLEKGEDAVVAMRGAIDHSAYYPMSVNLDRKDVFACYNPTYFPNPDFHPAPGPLVDPDRYMQVVIKTGQANAYTFSVNSPAMVIFRAEEGTMTDFVSAGGNVIQKPGSEKDRIVCLPKDWVLDGVEVFNGESSSNKKRLSPAIDASYVTLSRTFEGRTLMRRVDEARSAELGYEVLSDTNNSSNDFYERETQSLHE